MVQIAFGQISPSASSTRDLGTRSLRQNTGKPRRGMDGQNWRRLDCIWVNLKNVGPFFFKFVSVYIKISFTRTAGKSFSVVMWP